VFVRPGRLSWGIRVHPPKSPLQTVLRNWLEKMAKPKKRCVSLSSARRPVPASTFHEVCRAVESATRWRSFRDARQVVGRLSRGEGVEGARGDLPTTGEKSELTGRPRNSTGYGGAAAPPAGRVEELLSEFLRRARCEARLPSRSRRDWESKFRSASDAIDSERRRLGGWKR